jgi:hypothetical protein
MAQWLCDRGVTYHTQGFLSRGKGKGRGRGVEGEGRKGEGGKRRGFKKIHIKGFNLCLYTKHKYNFINI